MEEFILDEVRRDVFEHPKSTIDLDYLYSVKRQIQDFADNTNSQLKKNVYQNYALFIESSREISTLKDEMKQLNTLLDQQQMAMNKLLDQSNRTPIIQPNSDRPKEYVYNIPSGDVSETEAETFPAWFVKSPEDFDVLIAQRNLKEAVELAQRVKNHIEQYPAVAGRVDLKAKVDNRMQELVNAICSELQPATDRTVQGGPRSSISSIQLLRELNLSSRAVRLYLNQRSSVLKFVLDQQKPDSPPTVQYIKQLCGIFFQNTIETCSEFKQAFDINKNVLEALDESLYMLDIKIENRNIDDNLIFDLVKPIYLSPHPSAAGGSPSNSNGNDITSRLFSQPNEKVIESSINRNRKVFYYLSTYASLTNWTTHEFENLIQLFKRNVFGSSKLSISMIAESVYYLRNQCHKMAKYCEIDMSEFIERELSDPIDQIVDDAARKLSSNIKKLDSEEQWQPLQFQNKAQLTRFLEEMNEVELRTMQKYIYEDLKLKFTACKTSFARCYLITVCDLAKLVTPANKSRIDKLLADAFRMEMDHVLESLRKIAKSSKPTPSKVRFIMGNSNFLLDKVIVVAQEQYSRTANAECTELKDLSAKYHVKVKSVVDNK